MKVVIIGAGQDSSYMAEYVLDNTPHGVVVATRRTSSDRLDNLRQALANSRTRLATVDLNDAHSITSLVQTEKPDYLINLGGSTFVPDSFNSPAQVMTTNALSLIHILEAVRQYTPSCRVFSAGSSTESTGGSVYAVSKVAAGGICRVYRERYGLYVVHGILHNHCSPRQSDLFLPRKVAKGVARIARAIKEGKPFEPIELGNLDSQIDVSWAGDFVDGIWRMVNQETHRPGYPVYDPSWMCRPHDTYVDRSILEPPPPLKDYTLSSDSLHTVRELVERAFEAADIPGVWGYDVGFKGPLSDPMADAYVRTKQGPHGILGIGTLVRVNLALYRPVTVTHPGDSSATRRELGWAPTMSFDQLIAHMVRAELAAVGLDSDPQ